KKRTMTDTDIGSFEVCKRVLKLVMEKCVRVSFLGWCDLHVCDLKPCSFDDIY
ncbi:hypothetical protein J3A83DRAFT_4099944, partial [Scleroderma citrinum]